MTEQQIYDGVVVAGTADFMSVVETLRQSGMAWCVIDNFAINTYATAVYTAELDLVVRPAGLTTLLQNLRANGFKVQQRPDLLRIRRQFGPFVQGTCPLVLNLVMGERYQPFVLRASSRSVLGLEIPVAALKDVVEAKKWNLTDPTRRRSAQVKDRFDLLRLAEECFAETVPLLPDDLRAVAEADRARHLESGDNGWGDDDRGED